MSILAKPLIYDISPQQFFYLLENNDGIVVIKFGATWCGPCRRIDPLLKKYYSQMPANVQCVVVDIDNCPEMYSYMRTKKMVNGVPALLAYAKGNTSYVPDASVVGGDPQQVADFFKRVYDASQRI